MGDIQRITNLSEPPKRGRIYLVPTVAYEWCELTREWPVFLPRHDDVEHLNFPHDHYHIDPRFVERKLFRQAEGWRTNSFQKFQAIPLNQRSSNFLGYVEFPKLVWRALKCRRPTIHYGWRKEIYRKLTPAFAGQQCKRARSGWVCPHKHYPLGSHAPVDGVITCPLHGLRVNAATGVVMAAGETANSDVPLERMMRRAGA